MKHLNCLIIRLFLFSIMNEFDLNKLLDKIRSYPKENEWIEFKVNNLDPESVGKRISALSNGACLEREEFGYLVFGIEDETKEILGTKKHFGEIKKGNEELEHWVIQRLSPKIDFKVYDFYREGLKISIVVIPGAFSQPVRFKHEAYIRTVSYTHLTLPTILRV